MPKLEPNDELRSLIKLEEQRILNSFPLDHRVGLTEIARSVDIWWTSINVGDISDQEQLHNVSELMTLGLNKALSLFLDESWESSGFPLARSDEESTQWANSVLMHCGRLGLCEYLLEICRIDLGTLKKESDDTYRFQYSSSSPIGLEYFEKEDFNWRIRNISQSQKRKEKELQKKQHKIWKIMFDLVSPWQKYYIQYDADPEVDRFYAEVGELHVQKMFGQDSFPDNVIFGGHEFHLYKSTVKILVGWALKHASFCTQLIKKHPNIDLANILTIPQNFNEKVTDLANTLDVDLNVAKQLLSTMVLTFENKKVHCSVPGNFAAPAFIKISGIIFLRPIWGCSSHPYLFMLDELKRKYRLDWDRAVNQREDIFREELYSLFGDSKFVKISKSINIKIAGSIATDIDALILDKDTGVLGIFQLKWQDPFRNSMRERESRKRNFQKTSNKWIDSVERWLSSNSISEICKVCGLDTTNVKAFKIFVIGRNAAHFSGAGTLDLRAAWGTWYQLSRIVSEDLASKNSIAELHALMIKKSPLTRQLKAIQKKEIIIGTTRIRIG